MSEAIRLDIVALLPRLRAFARALARNGADADDLVQQTCEKALANLSGFAPGSRLDSWLFRIMHNQWIDTRRRHRPGLDIDDPAVAGTIAGEDGRVVTGARLDLDFVRKAIAALPDEQRSVLILVCVEGLRYREAAEIVGVPIGTVMSRLARARLTLNRMLEGEAALAAGVER